MLEKTIPHNRETEEAVLGSILIDHDAFYRVADAISADDFYLEKHKAIYGAMVEVSKRQEPVQLRAVCDELNRAGHLEEVGGPDYVLSLTAATPAAIHAEHYAREVKRLAICRRGIFLASQMAASFYDAPANPEAVIGDMGTKLLKLTEAIDRRNPDPGDIILRLMGQDVNKGIRLASPTLNYCTGGLQPSEFWVLGAFSSTGKTALALQWLREALDAKDGSGNPRNLSAVYFSLEMAQEQLMLRLLANYSGVGMKTIRYREEDKAQQKAVAAAQATLGGMKGRFWLYDDVYSAVEIGYIARKH
jgi:replicative DNA helicase